MPEKGKITNNKKKVIIMMSEYRTRKEESLELSEDRE